MRYMFRHASTQLFVGLALFMSGLSFQSTCADAADSPSTIVILDGSGSMWGKLDNERQTKLVIARDALKSSLAKIGPDARFGLASFGHRRQADCTDVQVIVAPEPGTVERINGILDKHNPRGKGPLTLALKEGATALGKSPGRKSLILIHDDPDNCQQDTCAALAELQSLAPGLQISVIGLGLKAEDAQRLMCLTKPTGGTLIDGQTAALIASGIDEVTRLAALEAPAAEPAPQPAPKTELPAATTAQPLAVPAQRLPLASTGPASVRLAALLASSAMPHPHSVRWSVTPEAPASVPVFTGTGQDIIVPLAPGLYTVEAQDGLVRATQRIAVNPEGQSNGDIILNAGILHLNLADGRDPVLAGLTTITIFETNTNATLSAALRPIGVLTAKDDTITLPSANYLIRIQRGQQTIDRPMTIASGRTEQLDVTINSARLSLNIVGSPPAAAQTSDVAAFTVFTIFEDDPDVPKGRREVTRSVAPQPDFILAPGTYYVVARQGRVEARERITLTAGETVRRSLTLQPARLNLSSRLPLPPGSRTAARDASPTPIGYRVERLDIVPPDIFTVNQAETTLLVPAGRYRIEAQHGRVNARTTRDIAVGPGETLDVAFEQKAGIALFKLTNETGSLFADIFWEVRDDTGRPVWTTVQSGPSAILQAGRYTVAAAIKDKRYQRTFEIKAGEQRTIEIAN
jgi:Ca-activated chloride channel homolog